MHSGFDIEVSPIIGATLYYIINVAVKFQFIIPFRITIPEKNLKLCKQSGDMCKTPDKALFASFTIAMKLNIIQFAYANTKMFSSVLGLLFKKKSPVKKLLMKGKGRKLNGKKPMKIIPRRRLGCIKLKGLLSPLNKHYRGKCCKGK